MSKTLGLKIPTLTKPDKECFDLRPKVADEWLNSLPRANVGETARRVFEALVEINRYRYPYQNRLHFLESARETILYITDSMKRHFVGINSPLPDKNQKIVAATREIHHAYAIGYLIAIEGYLSQNLFFSDNKLIATMIQRAMSSLGKVLLTCYQTYTPYPNGIWSEIHKLYMAAETHKLLTMNVVDEQNVHHIKTCINSEYIRLILLALTAPYRLRHGEVGKVYTVLERWTQKIRLKAPENITKSNTVFAVNLASDEPPRNYSLANQYNDDEFLRIFDSKALTNAIRKDLKHGFKTGETTITSIEMNRPDLSQDLMKRLLISWCVVPKRSYPRTDTDEHIHITIGLSTTHQVIIMGNQQAAVDDSQQYDHAATFEANNVSNSVTDDQPDVWDMIYFPNDAEGMESLEEQFNKEQGNSVQQVKQQAETWIMLNESARGYCIKSTSKGGKKAQVGELVGVRRRSSRSNWKWGVGVIRWLKTDSSKGLLLGIEMLTPDAAAIGMRAVNNAKHDYQRVLMLPELSAVNQPTSLITTAVPYRTGHKLVINILGKEILIQLSKQVQNTGLFAQFQFEIMEEQSAVLQGEHHEETREQDFDNVWSSI